MKKMRIMHIMFAIAGAVIVAIPKAHLSKKFFKSRRLGRRIILGLLTAYEVESVHGRDVDRHDDAAAGCVYHLLWERPSPDSASVGTP